MADIAPHFFPQDNSTQLLNGGKTSAKSFTKMQVKNLAVRKWISISSRGDTTVLEIDKLRVTHQLGVQLRDLRLLDPKLATSYPSAILCRDKALVVNMEFIKCVVTTSYVYVTNLEDDSAVLFVEELQRRLAAAHEASLVAETAAAGTGNTVLPSTKQYQPPGTTFDHFGMHTDQMPFELRVLEVALDTVTGYLERLAGDLEAAAHPALDSLTAKINTSNLERVRRIKNRMVRLTTRVETLREVLEKFLDDDSDMKDMNLTAKQEEEQALLQRQLMRASISATPLDVPMPVHSLGAGEGAALTPFTLRSVSSLSSDSTNSEDDEAVEAVEMLLEPYFMQLDNTWNQLQTLCEYVDDTEDFINIELDSHRNGLIRIDLILTAFTASMALITAFTALFAMNVQLRPNAENPGPYSMFVSVSVTSGVMALVVFCGVLCYSRWKKII